jgi:hypothetical protein
MPDQKSSQGEQKISRDELANLLTKISRANTRPSSRTWCIQRC